MHTGSGVEIPVNKTPHLRLNGDETTGGIDMAQRMNKDEVKGLPVTPYAALRITLQSGDLLFEPHRDRLCIGPIRPGPAP